MAITPVQQICPSSKWNIKCPYTMVPEFIVVHNTANDASALNEITYMNNNNNEVSFHFAIDDVEVRQGIPLNRNAWHAGDGANGRGNRKGIAIEICYSLSGGSRFEKAEKLAAKFIAQLLTEYGWGVEGQVTKHQDWSGKYCPHRTLDLGWDRFKGMIEAEWQALNKPKIEWKDQEKKTYIVVNNTNLVNVANGEPVRVFTAGNLLDFVQYCTYKDKVYYRTEYSRDNKINNGIPASDVIEYVPEKEKLVWEKLPEPLTKVTLRDAKLIDVKTGETIEVYQPGTVIEDIVDRADYNDVVFVRTKETKEKNKDYGIDSYHLTAYVAPSDEPEEPAPELPEGDLERPEDAPPIDGDTEYPNWFISFLNAVLRFIEKLIGKKGD